MNKGVSAEACTRSQKIPRDSKKITLEEYQSLVQYNLYPTFNPDGDFAGVCSCGCFAKGTRIAVVDAASSSSSPKWIAIENMESSFLNTTVWSFADEATFKNFNFSPRKISRFTKGPEVDPLIFVTTFSGNSIGLTKAHAMLLADGTMARADALKIGDQLVSMQGTPDAIIDIKIAKTQDDVYNVLVDGNTNQSHLILANRLVAGDLAWQNSLASELNAVQVRS
jgi:hypothetical protein